MTEKEEKPKEKCSYCGQEGHNLYSCPVFISTMTISIS